MTIHFNDSHMALLSFLVFIFAFIFLFALLFIWLPYRLCGWSSLAKLYPYKGNIPAKHYRCDIQMRYMLACSPAVAITEQGLYFGSTMLFRFGVPQIFIPWEDITITKSKLIKLAFKKAPLIPIVFVKDTYVFQNDLCMSSPKAVVIVC
jgi:hypothetical protein